MDNTDRDSVMGDVPATGQLGGTVAVTGEVTPTDWSVLPVVKGSEDSVVMELWRLLKQEPR